MASPIALVTGASRGIGRAIAITLGKAGYTVVINYASRKEAAEETLSEIKAAGGSGITWAADVSDVEHIRNMFNHVESSLGKIHTVVANAGIGMPALTHLKDTPDDVIDKMYHVNTVGVAHILKEAAARVVDEGRVITITTTLVSTAAPGYAVYASSKAAVETLTRIVAKEVGSRKVTVNAVAPGPVATELFFTGKSEELVARSAAAAPLNRLGEADEIANVVKFLASAEASWVNGQVIRVNGGVAS